MTVTPSCTMVSSERSQSKRGISTRVHPLIKREIQADGQAIDVIQRKEAQQHILIAEGAKFSRRERLVDIGDQVVMRQHDAFG